MINRLAKMLTLAWSLAACVRAEPWLANTDVFISGKDGYHTYRIPALETAPDGQVLCDTCLVSSQDGGETWEAEPRVVAPGWPSSAPVRELPDDIEFLEPNAR